MLNVCACVCEGNVSVCVCKRKHKEKEGKEECIHAQKLLALDFWIRPTVTGAYELIYFNLY